MRCQRKLQPNKPPLSPTGAVSAKAGPIRVPTACSATYDGSCHGLDSPIMVTPLLYVLRGCVYCIRQLQWFVLHALRVNIIDVGPAYMLSVKHTNLHKSVVRYQRKLCPRPPLPLQGRGVSRYMLYANHSCSYSSNQGVVQAQPFAPRIATENACAHCHLRSCNVGPRVLPTV